MNIRFEEVLSLTMRTFEDGDYELPHATAWGVSRYLRAARQAYLDGDVSGDKVLNTYTRTLVAATHQRLNDPSPHALVKNGYRLAERIMTYHCRMLAGDKHQQTRLETVIGKLQLRIADEPEAVRRVAAAYAEVYLGLTTPELFTREGRPVGRAAAAAQRIARRSSGGSGAEKRRLQQLLTRLKDLTIALDQESK